MSYDCLRIGPCERANLLRTRRPIWALVEPFLCPHWVKFDKIATVGMSAVLAIAAPFLFGFAGLDAIYYWANGGAVLIVVSLHKPEEAMCKLNRRRKSFFGPELNIIEPTNWDDRFDHHTV